MVSPRCNHGHRVDALRILSEPVAGATAVARGGEAPSTGQGDGSGVDFGLTVSGSSVTVFTG
jgi:hypothetical protein